MLASSKRCLAASIQHVRAFETLCSQSTRGPQNSPSLLSNKAPSGTGINVLPKRCMFQPMAACKDAKRFFPEVTTPLLPKDSLKGKIAFITGGGTGLGKSIATALATAGADVAIAARRLDVLEATAKEIADKTGRKVIAIRLDVKDASAVTTAADECVRRMGALPSIVVNNAAGNFINATERLSPNAFKAIVDIVFLGTVYVTLEFAKRMIKQQTGGSFLSISTGYASTGSPFVVPSATSKAACDTLTKSLAAEWGKYGLRFNSIAPGPIYTEGAFSRLSPSNVLPTASDVSVAGLPAGRLGQPEELANLAAYVLSDYASWMNGDIIVFDGGEQKLAGFSKLHELTPENWQQIEDSIRGKTGKGKSKI